MTVTDDIATVPGLTVERDGAVLTVRLDSPGGNLMSMDMCDALAAVLTVPPAGVHLLVLSAAGDSFCLGRERTAATPEDLPTEVRRLIAVNEALAATPLVTVARVHGDAAGFGVGLAALCDVAVATRTARFSFPEVRINLAPALVLAWLPHMVGRRAAFWLTASGLPVSGDEAVRLGLLNEVVEDVGALDAAVNEKVGALLAGEPRVHNEIRAMLRSVESLSERQSYELAADRLVLGSLKRLHIPGH
ncbi:enoyl-CoA hydratase/isomerase family protein [Mycolicibacterium litorale]|uniref:Enoyl-CoA hydratase n=1 Tax=Mycolicibacterium litorale TaxID=758802 RepID=A0AAD1MTZ0_9MYCO|nr:enoyl-CoA hydratase/isomerase family protein [Mycolicibacterium litorale]MCV7418826.1 enoyl-CoA hydratase/isomerase family protein [Mycolicibacterium litorale]TDY00390.1 methylglutaconyl-CoA hydratase [Mycolicibacterium litorale]BBY15777.1 enoyl-CoA hydratase [Mycolicibacterium litorale]